MRSLKSTNRIVKTFGFMALSALYGKEAAALTVDQKGTWYVATFFWTAVIWIMEVRSSVHGVRRMRLKGKLEKSDMELPNKWTLLKATNAVACLYAATGAASVVQRVNAWGPEL